MRYSQRAVAAVLGVVVSLMIVAAVWIRVTAPEPPQLSGERTTDAYDYTDFDGVDVDGPWQVTIERGDTWRVSVEVPEELVDQVRVERDGDALELDYEGVWWAADFGGEGRTLQATITMPALEMLDVSGPARLMFSGFEGSHLTLDLSGAVELRGATSRFDALTLDLSGAGSVDFADVPVTDANVDISGAANVTLRMAGGRLVGDLSGASSLEYYGTVSEESIDRAGVVSIRRRN